MSEQRFIFYEYDDGTETIEDTEENEYYHFSNELVGLLNRQQSLINRLKTELKCYKGIIEALERTRVIEVEIPIDKVRDSKMVIDDE